MSQYKLVSNLSRLCPPATRLGSTDDTSLTFGNAFEASHCAFKAVSLACCSADRGIVTGCGDMSAVAALLSLSASFGASLPETASSSESSELTSSSIRSPSETVWVALSSSNSNSKVPSVFCESTVPECQRLLMVRKFAGQLTSTTLTGIIFPIFNPLALRAHSGRDGGEDAVRNILGEQIKPGCVQGECERHKGSALS